MKLNTFLFWLTKVLRWLFPVPPAANTSSAPSSQVPHIDSTYAEVQGTAPVIPQAEKPDLESGVPGGDLPKADIEIIQEPMPGPSVPAAAAPLFVWNGAIVRNDKAGKGGFLVCRGGDCKRKHMGVDFFVKPGMLITSPVDGWYVRVAYPYPDAPNWTGVVLKGTDGTEVKIFYCAPQLAKGSRVRKGQVVAIAMDISRKYPGQGMLPHIHVEARRKNTLLNPQDLFTV